MPASSLFGFAHHSRLKNPGGLTAFRAFAMIYQNSTQEATIMGKVILLSAVVLLVSAAPLLAAPPNMQPGNWEITMAVQMEGVPFAMPPMKVTHCYTKQDLEDSKKTLPSGSNKKENCEVKDMKVVGNHATWNMVCKDGTKGSGEITYKGTTYDSTLKLVTKDGVKTTTNIKAKRIGDCK
jgi:hypothetical protein